MTRRLFLSAGEASGDSYAAALAAQLPEFEISGVGGRRSRAAGVHLIADSSTWGAISITEALKKYPSIVRGYYAAKRALRQGEPGVLVVIDFGYMNIRLARHGKRLGWKVMYFVPPGSWRRDRQGKDLPAITDMIVTPFSWSAEMLNAMGAKAYWFGHPLLEIIEGKAVDARQGTAVLPGSRSHELTELIPMFAKALKGEEVTLALAPGADEAAISAEWEWISGRKPAIVIGDTARVLRKAELALVCSGTATLEAAILGTPMVVAYRVSAAVVREAKLLRFKRPRWIALPNILLGEDAVPELLQDECTVDTIRTEMDKLRLDSSVQRDAFSRLRPILGESDAVTRTASLIRELAA